MIHDKKHLKYTAIPDEEMYWKRVNRSLGWLGDTKQEQHNKQEKLKNVVIGIAGTGGIGGQLAQRLVRMGVRNLKLADPDTFDISNMNRQMGADLQHIGKNKAEVVAEMTYSLNHDVNIAVYPEGITKETAEDFVQDCDYVLDQMEFYEIANRYALHRAFRKSSKAKLIFKVPTVAHGTYIFKYTKDSMKIEDVYGIKEDSELSPKVIHRLMERIIPHMPKYPSKETLDHWFVDMHRMPIFAACPPIAEGVLAERLAQEITGLNKLPGAIEVPAQPGYVYFDTLNWTTEVKKGKWWTDDTKI
ncbi:molybdopterin and thiamine biosynthesis dinucleotide-utilizing enzyme [Limosilactobacillus gastricus DSM 16045]|uniref:Molybdopterin and thiamine biosynthesis dinucleotide-utilizing enzyme n=1 Tax=Limosilactobacillus gastricus DSM 16045 TaxID=1423749 RepID=A0A0R1V5J7_9LACO|nr:ThiF family adenylyltransferase [Limosilactobacillus gastricus]KRM00829.1 molybdopterin and thiamine biosynthesis dinucleotide-utilizing enzyme [Limosilactobacillus gastricus DSM 16045]